jgi:hypothetical protein
MSERQQELLRNRWILYGLKSHFELISRFHSLERPNSRVDLDSYLRIRSNEPQREQGQQYRYPDEMRYRLRSRTVRPSREQLWEQSAERDYSPQIEEHVKLSHVLKAKESAWELVPRAGHSMVFSHSMRLLYILGGQGNKSCFPQLLAYDVDLGQLTKLPLNEGIDATITQRAVIDERINSLILLSTLIPRPGSGSVTLGPALHTFDINCNSWHRIPCALNDSSTPTSMPTPTSRSAYSLVYDSLTQSVFIFGGNPEIPTAPHLRLADFWMLRLRRPDASDIIRLCTFLIRRQKFLMLCKSHPLHALRYLRSVVAHAIDHSNPLEEREFSKLPSALFKGRKSSTDTTSTFSPPASALSPGSALGATSGGPQPILDPADGAPIVRPTDSEELSALHELYDRILRFVPSSMKQPTGSLVDRISLD